MIPDWSIPWLGLVCFAFGIGGIFLLAHRRGVRDAEEDEEAVEEKEVS